MKTVQAELPEKLHDQIKALIDEGWFTNEKDVITEALRRFLETHKRPSGARLNCRINDLQPVELEFDEECRELAMEYIRRGIIPKKYEDDAYHIAVATVGNLDAIISWNFEHIVKLKTKREITGTNLLLGYKELEIYSPLEVSSDD